MSRIEGLGSLAGVGQAVSLSPRDARSNGGLAAQVEGTFVGTVTFEGSLNGVTYFPVAATNVSTGALASTTTAPGLYRAEVVGGMTFRARMSAYTSGTADVKLVGFEG